jgi:hypothetical protein
MSEKMPVSVRELSREELGNKLIVKLLLPMLRKANFTVDTINKIIKEIKEKHFISMNNQSTFILDSTKKRVIITTPSLNTTSSLDSYIDYE